MRLELLEEINLTVLTEFPPNDDHKASEQNNPLADIGKDSANQCHFVLSKTPRRVSSLSL